MSTVVVYAEDGIVRVQGAVEGAGAYEKPVSFVFSGEGAAVHIGLTDPWALVGAVEAMPLLPVRIGPGPDPASPEVVIEGVALVTVEKT